jgi:hypothetical protein
MVPRFMVCNCILFLESTLGYAKGLSKRKMIYYLSFCAIFFWAVWKEQNLLVQGDDIVPHCLMFVSVFIQVLLVVWSLCSVMRWWLSQIVWVMRICLMTEYPGGVTFILSNYLITNSCSSISWLACFCIYPNFSFFMFWCCLLQPP